MLDPHLKLGVRMPAKHVVANKNPLHPSALRVGDLTVGRRIVRFNARIGVVAEYTVVKKPHLGYIVPDFLRHGGGQKSLVVTMRNEHGRTENHDLGDLGVIPYGKWSIWHGSNVTVDARKRHLLPAPLPSAIPGEFAGFYEEEEEEEEWA